MSQSERIAVPCPACAPSVETAHEVVSAGEGQLTVRCRDCGHVHKSTPPDGATVSRRVVVSQAGESFVTSVEAPADETVAVGEEFVVDTEEAILGVRITGLEVGADRRVDAAPVSDVETLWTRAVDNVTVDVTVHPADGSRDRTRSVELAVPGEQRFVVGETEAFGEERFRVEGLHVRDDATGYPAPKLDRRGDAAAAKDLKRVYARDRSNTAWSAW